MNQRNLSFPFTVFPKKQKLSKVHMPYILFNETEIAPQNHIGSNLLNIPIWFCILLTS